VWLFLVQVLYRLATKLLDFYCGAQRLDFPAEEGQKKAVKQKFQEISA